jgi:hypothetical protein
MNRVADQLRLLYRSRPFTKSVPFNVLLPTDPTIVAPLWLPENAYFEVSIIVARSDTAGVDINFCDTTQHNPFLFAMLPTTTYQVIDISPGYRSLQYMSAKLGVTNPAGTAAVNIKGIILGWEVNPDGYYR